MLLVCEPHFDQRRLRHSLGLLLWLCSLCPAPLWMQHNALLRLGNKAMTTLHPTSSLVFHLRILGSSLSQFSFQGPASSKLWKMECQQFSQPQEVLTSNQQQQQKAGTLNMKPPLVYISRQADPRSPGSSASHSRMSEECASSLLKLHYHY